MTSFEAGDIVIVNYPHVESKLHRRRPALVVSAGALGPDKFVLWAAMITSASNQPWPGDVSINDFRTLGLPIPSVVRTDKIATLECSGAERLSCVPPQLLQEVQNRIAQNLGLSVTTRTGSGEKS
jgi:mRNA interferase MazF